MFGFVGAPMLRATVSASRAAWVCGGRLPIVVTKRGAGARMSSSPPSDDTIMKMVEKKITDALEPRRLVVTPTYGDPNGSHVSITVVSDAFEGLNAVKRHQVVYKAIWEELSGPIHAVDELVTKTPTEDEK